MGRGNSGTTLPYGMRLDVPKFNGTDPKSWIFSITEYFASLNTLADQRLKVVGFNLEGEDAEWFRWMIRNKLITDWDGFAESMRNRFGPSKYEDPQGTLSKLLQTGTTTTLTTFPIDILGLSSATCRWGMIDRDTFPSETMGPIYFQSSN
nr:retrovirus-related Pol polyprotein from transposon opus [Tanacetum cinerariifolium]